MKQRLVVYSAALTLALTPVAAVAGDRPYPHKAGADAATVEAEQAECFEAAQLAMRNPRAPDPYNPVTQTTTAGAIGAGFAAGIEQGRAFKLTYLGCMDAKGYTQRALPKAEWKAIRKLPQAERRARLTALTTAAEPAHPEIPRDEID